MAIAEQLEVLKQGVEVWNKWRPENPSVYIDLSGADLKGTNLRGINLREANADGADLRDAKLNGADLTGSNLSEANLSGADLTEVALISAYLNSAQLLASNLSGANLSGANLSGADLNGADLGKADVRKARLWKAHLFKTNFSCADLREADLRGSDLKQADLSQANLSKAYLGEATLLGTVIERANVSGSLVYGISVWDLEGEFEDQRDLVITRRGDPIITVDNIKIAQFIYLILNNKEIRDVINTLTSKSVLILGRFAIPERKAILDALREKLREYDLLPIVFDFDRPTDKDFTETIKTLAGLSYFVIADVTNPKSSPLELQATVPDYQIPFVPIIQEGEQPFAMMVDLQKKYNWVLDTISYDSLDTLIEILKPHIIDPAIKKRDELRLIKAKEPTIISGRELRKKK
jgi:uncharacterized protein YjbI with pentapeptide repeats